MKERQPAISLTNAGNLRIHVPISFKNKSGRKLILMPQALDGANPEAHSAQQEAVVTALARAFAWSEMLERGEVASIRDLAHRLNIDASYIGRLLRLTTLAPDIIEAILCGQEPAELSLTKLTRTAPADWAEQRAMFGFQRAHLDSATRIGESKGEGGNVVHPQILDAVRPVAWTRSQRESRPWPGWRSKPWKRGVNGPGKKLSAICKNSPTSKATFPPLSGQTLIRTRPHRIRLTTSAGEVCITSVYGQDAQTGRWFCPLRQGWGLTPRQELSPILQERLCFTATLTGSYEAAARVAGKWGSPADDTTIHAHVQRVGARAAALAAARVEQALDPATRGQAVAQAKQDRGEQPFSLVIEMDGWMVRERGTQWGLKPPEKQGDRVAWHEMKTAIVFRLGQRAQTQSGRPVILEKFYVAHRGGPHEFGRQLYAQALRRGLHQAQRVYVVADGGVWIWNIAADRFGEATGVLDFYHASEHLWAVARAIHEDEAGARRWVEPLLHQLKHGGQERVLRRLENLTQRCGQYPQSVQTLIKTETNYFVGHRDHMRYQEVEREGCPKGSGAMESTCSQFQDRFKRTGQFWTLPGEHCLLALELARRNQDWDEIWELAA